MSKRYIPTASMDCGHHWHAELMDTLTGAVHTAKTFTNTERNARKYAREWAKRWEAKRDLKKEKSSPEYLWSKVTV